MSVHDGHRDRLRDGFLKHGLEHMNDINALELLLFYAIPRRDTNELAHRLIEHFGSLDEVFAACMLLGTRLSLTALVKEAASEARSSSSPFCSALWTRLMTAVFKPEKLIS